MEERKRGEREWELQRRAARRQRYVIGLTGLASLAPAVLLVITLLLLQLQAANQTLQRSLPVSVTNLNDHGPESLREAITKASPGSTITFGKNLKGPITLTSGELKITKDLIISGPGARTLSLSGNHTSRVFNVSPDIAVTISGLTIENGYADGSGGGIANGGVLTLTYSTISGNATNSSSASRHYGGGIDNYGTLTITNSTISGNTGGEGGGITNFSGTLTIYNSTISNNTGQMGSGGIENFGKLSLYASTISGNRTKSGIVNDTIGEKDFGGGIYNEGTLTLSGSTISGNTADKDGGGIANAFAGNVRFVSSTISDNTSHSGGGGIANFDSGAVILSHSTISGNSAVQGGAIFTNSLGSVTLGSSTVSGNTATNEGGAIEAKSGEVDLVYCTIYNNMATVGGGIAIAEAGSSVTATMETSIVAGDHAGSGSDISGKVFLYSRNLIQSLSGATLVFGANDDLTRNPITGKAPNLGPLQNNGGLIKTHALLPGSPAIDQIPPGAICGADDYNEFFWVDERGVQRPKGAGCDLGAYEYVPSK